MKRLNLEGQRFGRLVAVCHGSQVSSWLCRCDCGAETVVRTQNLRNGRTQSCGCYHREQAAAAKRSHGEGRHRRGARPTPEYVSWTHMLARCRNPNHKNWADYGGRGITVCERWLQFSSFLRDVGRRPGPGYTIDRIDVNGNYEPGNVRWATQKQQCRNRRDTRWFEYEGERLTLPQWAERLGLLPGTLSGRLLRGWSVEETLSTPRLRSRRLL